MAIGISNARGGAGAGASPTIQITKSYTIGYADVQPLLLGGFNEGISEHCVVAILAPSSPITSNSYATTGGSPSGSNTITATIINAVWGIRGIGKSIVVYTQASGYSTCCAPFNDNGTTKYGLTSKAGEATSTDYNGLQIQIRCKPFATINGGTVVGTTASLRANLRLLCWNINTNEYETIEWSNISTPVGTSSNAYKYSGYMNCNLANNYILCGILEANITPEVSSGYSYKWLTEEDIPE